MHLQWSLLKKTQRGFTIVELLVVIVVLGILAGITTVGWNSIRTESLKKQTQAELTLVRSQFEKFKSLNSRYPTDIPSDYRTNNDVTISYAPGGDKAQYCINAVAVKIPTVKYYINSQQDKAKVQEGECGGGNAPATPIIANNGEDLYYNTTMNTMYVQITPSTGPTALSYKISYKNPNGEWTVATATSSSTTAEGKPLYTFGYSSPLVTSYLSYFNANPSGALRIVAVGAGGVTSLPLDTAYTAIQQFS